MQQSLVMRNCRWVRLIRACVVAGLAAHAGDTSLLAQAAESRASLIARAHVWTATDIPSMDVRRGPRAQDAFAPGATVTCDYLDEDVNGNSPKFQCRVGPGDDVKVKYGGSNGEVYGEVAATRLLWTLGFGADRMYPVRVICRGCPDVIGGQLLPDGNRLVVPAVVERRMPAAELPGALASGWSWTELDLIDEQAGGATRAERDALKLLAAFIQHTDTKPEQQRLVCVEEGARGEEAGPEGPPVRRGNGADTDACERPFMMLNDVGLTFGRANVLNANAIGQRQPDGMGEHAGLERHGRMRRQRGEVLQRHAEGSGDQRGRPAVPCRTARAAHRVAASRSLRDGPSRSPSALARRPGLRLRDGSGLGSGVQPERGRGREPALSRPLVERHAHRIWRGAGALGAVVGVARAHARDERRLAPRLHACVYCVRRRPGLRLPPPHRRRPAAPDRAHGRSERHGQDRRQLRRDPMRSMRGSSPSHCFSRPTTKTARLAARPTLSRRSAFLPVTSPRRRPFSSVSRSCFDGDGRGAPCSSGFR